MILLYFFRLSFDAGRLPRKKFTKISLIIFTCSSETDFNRPNACFLDVPNKSDKKLPFTVDILNVFDRNDPHQSGVRIYTLIFTFLEPLMEKTSLNSPKITAVTGSVMGLLK